MDIASLLSGIARNETAFLDHIKMAVAHHTKPPHEVYHLPNDVAIQYHSGEHSKGRNFTVSVSSLNASLHFRFAGHSDLTKDKEGISAFLHPSFMSEFLCVFAPEMSMEPSDCPPLHALVMNSGQHDTYSAVFPKGKIHTWFAMHLDMLLSLLAPHQAAANHRIGSATNSVKPFRVIWRGNTMSWTDRLTQLLRDLDEIARVRVQAVGIPFVDVAAILHTVPNFPTDGVGLHLGMHVYKIFIKDHPGRNKFTASSLVTNALLREMCPLPLQTVQAS